MLRKIILTSALIGLCVSGASAQFYSIDAGTYGFNFHISNVRPAPISLMLAPPPAPVGFGIAAPAPRHYQKAIKKARKAYYKELRHHAASAAYFYGPSMMYVGYDDDDYYDDYDDYMEDVYKARKKAYKHYKKKMKKHFKHHHHDD